MKTKKLRLKLYVWEGVFCDYTTDDGIALALATSPDHARKLIAKAYTPANRNSTSVKFWREIVNKELAGEPQVITRARGFQA